MPEERRILWTYASVTLERRDGGVQLVSWTVTWVPGHGPPLAAPFAPGTSSAVAEALGASWDEAYTFWELDGFAGTVDEPAPGPTAPPGSVIRAVHAGTWRC